MKSIFNMTEAIQVNKPWNYDDSNHKWTIDENDVIVHTELSEEIYSDFHKLDQYNLVLEEAYNCFDRLIKQLNTNNDILSNSKISLEHISLSNECLSIYKAQLGYDVTVNRSNESDMTNYERLVISSEGIKDFLKELWEKIKSLIKKIYNFIKGLIVKLLTWLGFYKDDTIKKANAIKEHMSKSNISSEDYFLERIRELSVNFNNVHVKTYIAMSEEEIKKFAEDNINFIGLALLCGAKEFKDILKVLDISTYFNQFRSNNIDKFLNCLIEIYTNGRPNILLKQYYSK